MSNETVAVGRDATVRCVVKHLQDYKVTLLNPLCNIMLQQQPWLFSGGIHSHRSSDDPDHWQSRDHTYPTFLHHPRQALYVVAENPERPKGGQGLLHVPSQYRSDGIQSGLFRCSR